MPRIMMAPGTDDSASGKPARLTLWYQSNLPIPRSVRSTRVLSSSRFRTRSAVSFKLARSSPRPATSCKACWAQAYPAQAWSSVFEQLA